MLIIFGLTKLKFRGGVEENLGLKRSSSQSVSTYTDVCVPGGKKKRFRMLRQKPTQVLP